MERVTNVFCGGGGVAYTNLQSANNVNNTIPEKPSRSVPTSMNNMSTGNNKSLNNGTGSRPRISRNKSKTVGGLASAGTGGYVAPTTWEQLLQDDHFLGRFFLYFNATERRILAQVKLTNPNPDRFYLRCLRSLNVQRLIFNVVVYVFRYARDGETFYTRDQDYGQAWYR